MATILILSLIGLGIDVRLWVSGDWLRLFCDWIQSSGRTL